MTILSRLRDKTLNPLMWPFFLSTLAYGIGALLSDTGTHGSSLVVALVDIHPLAHFIWGALAVFIIVGLLISLGTGAIKFMQTLTIMAFMLWVFAVLCYSLVGGWVPLFAVAVPNMIFWTFMYLRVSVNRVWEYE
jgi:hypothetical protein